MTIGIHIGDWRFRKNGLVDNDNNQEGAIPVLLTLFTLTHILDHPNLVYSTAIKLHGEGYDCESDFSGVDYRSQKEMELAGIGKVIAVIRIGYHGGNNPDN